MWFLLLGCNTPFTCLCLVFLGSMLCSFLMDVEAETASPKVIGKRLTPTVLNHPEVFQAQTQTHSHTQHSLFSQTEGEGIRFDDARFQPLISKHYTCPPTSIETLRKRYGKGSMWGEWSSSETRQFYKTQLPKALQIDGALGLTLEQRAHLASASRHALRSYARERCHLPGRLLARAYDGLRHLYAFGSWSASGMGWSQVKEKYRRQALRALGSSASEEDISLFVYGRIVDKACSTNVIFDTIAAHDYLRVLEGMGGMGGVAGLGGMGLGSLYEFLEGSGSETGGQGMRQMQTEDAYEGIGEGMEEVARGTILSSSQNKVYSESIRIGALVAPALFEAPRPTENMQTPSMQTPNLLAQMPGRGTNLTSMGSIGSLGGLGGLALLLANTL